MAQDFDAAFVGSGHNALACALHLASKGWRVGVFERAPDPGGAVKSGEYTLPGFRHDWAAMNLSLFAGSGFHKRHGAELARHGLAFVPAAHPFASAFPDGRWLGVSTDLNATVARIADFSRDDAETWRRLVRAFPQDAQAIFALLGSPMTMRALASFSWRTSGRGGLSGTFDLVRFLLTSPRRWLPTPSRRPSCGRCSGPGGCTSTSPRTSPGARCSLPRRHGGSGLRHGRRQGGADTVTARSGRHPGARAASSRPPRPVARILRVTAPARPAWSSPHGRR
jgi:phytoene dehydrogenase-like protein